MKKKLKILNPALIVLADMWRIVGGFCRIEVGDICQNGIITHAKYDPSDARVTFLTNSYVSAEDDPLLEMVVKVSSTITIPWDEVKRTETGFDLYLEQSESTSITLTIDVHDPGEEMSFAC
jgi:hypothetical protein